MKETLILLIILFLYINTGYAQWEKRDTVEFQARDGLPNFFNKVQNNEVINVGFFGGSITENEGWRPKTVAWLREYYHLGMLNDFDASIGGTNSKFGVFRLDRDLLSKADFDLIFVEFVVNDGWGGSSDVQKSMEGMVRKIWKQNPYTDICFVYTVSGSFFDDYEEGLMNLSASKHDAIADHYSIPAIFWGTEVTKLLKTDSVVYNDRIANHRTSQNSEGQYVFAIDNVHPTDYGHGVYASVLARSFKTINHNTQPKAHIIQPKLVPDNYEFSKMLSPILPNNHGFNQIDMAGEVPYLDHFINEETFYLVSEQSSSSYTFSFIGDQVGVNTIFGPTGGYFIIEVDGIPRDFITFDGFSTYYRKQAYFYQLPTYGEHFVKIYPSDQSLSLEEKRDILYTSKDDIDENPDKYNKNEFIFSDVFIVGELTNYLVDTINLCGKEGIVWNGNTYSEPGTYYATFTLPNGFDRVFQLNLSNTPSYFLEYTDTIQAGENLIWEGQTLTEAGIYSAKYTTVNGCDSILRLDLSVRHTTSSNERTKDLTFSIYPNPSMDTIFLNAASSSWPSKSRITISDVEGYVVKDQYIQLVNGRGTIDISSLQKGIYFLKLGKEKAYRFVKQ